MSPFDPEALLKALVDGGVDFVLIGGLAVASHGLVRATQDIDIYHPRDAQNLELLATALRGVRARLRGAEDVPLKLDVKLLQSAQNFTFSTDLGDLDCLGYVDGAAEYEVVKSRAIQASLGPVSIKVASVHDLLSMKERAARPKDILDAAALRRVQTGMTGEC